MVTRMLRSGMLRSGTGRLYGGRAARVGSRLGFGALIAVLMAVPGTAFVSPAGAGPVGTETSLDGDRLAASVQLAQLPRSLTDNVGGSMATPVQGFSSDYAASVETRIQSLEREISRLTGQVEELRFRNDQLSSRLDRVLNDIEFRLSDLESADMSMSGPADSGPTDSGDVVDQSAAAPDRSDSEATSSPPAASGDGPTISGDGDMSDTVRTLGTIPLSPGRPSPPGNPSPQSDAGSSDSQQSDSQLSASGVLSGEGESVASLPQPRPEDDGTASRDYDAAYGLLTQGRHAEAEDAFRAFVERHADHRLADNARYWLGETFYIRERYEDAARTFASAFQQSPEGNKAPDNLLKLGLSLASLDQADDACTALERVNNAFPDAPETITQRARQERSRLSC